MQTQNYEIQHLAEVLQRYMRIEGSWSQLTDEIDKANNFDPGRRIDRRTLKRLCTEECTSVQLRIGQILALDHWLGLKDEGSLLARRRSLIDSVGESYNVNFLVAAAYSPQMHTDVIRRWDLRATTRLMRTPLNQLHVAIWDITGPENWREQDVRIVNAANISIGSPVASHVSQVLMSRMVGIAHNQPINFEALPFFIVGCERDETLERSFVRPRSEISRTDYVGQLPKNPNKRALVVNGKWYVSDDENDYALLLAQRNPDNGHVQMVICGLTGQGTYQLSRIVQSGQPAETMPALEAGQWRPPIFIAIYRLTPSAASAGGGRNGHEVIDGVAIDSPMLAHSVDDEWQFSR
ncbi:MAG: hypothetical protein GY935_19345 [Gammaproteobacteria bacterium]|nr:hypothetical protein [Gammaproteobacteria bacterium]